MPVNFNAAAVLLGVAEDRHVDLQVLECLDERLLVRLRVVDADGVERHLRIVLVPLIHLFQIRQALPARRAPSGPEIEHRNLSGQRFRRDRLAVEVVELEVRHFLAQQLQIGDLRRNEELHDLRARGHLELKRLRVDLAVDLRAGELGHQRDAIDRLLVADALADVRRSAKRRAAG